MTRPHYILLVIGITLTGILFWGLPTVSHTKKQRDEQRGLAAESVSIETVRKQAFGALDASLTGVLETLEAKVRETADPGEKSDLLKDLAGRWFKLDNPAMSGYYAEQVAEIEKTAAAWSIAGTTYTICIQKTGDEKTRSYCSARARAVFESAISLEPDNVSHRINLAVALVEAPPQDNPMQGITMLLGLQEENPDNVSILYNLGRFAMRTGQTDRAIQRLEQAAALDPGSDVIACMLGDAYVQAGDEAKAAPLRKRCSTQR